MTTLRLVLGDQLSHDLAALEGLDVESDIVLMMEVADETTYVAHHKQKIVLVLSAMRHFAAELIQRGVTVDYVRLDAADNTGSFTTELQRAVARHAPDSIVLTDPSEWRVLEMVRRWPDLFNVPVEVRADTRFFASRARFSAWAKGRRGWRMEHFYREMRRKHGVLMDGDQPAGG
eukprot:gene19866-20370_t